MAMSPDAIRDQLVNFDKFTQEEADYAVQNLK
nr:MAG TPA: Host cell surface-exposed lipoprotein [Caudoviricetes sp.]